MKRLFSLVLIFTIVFSTQVIFAADGTGKRETATKVKYLSTQPLSYKQDSDIVIDKIKKDKEISILVDSSSGMNEYVKDNPSPFDYALFSGSTTEDLVMNSSDINITGSVHGNKSVEMNLGSITVEGSIEAVEKVTISKGKKVNKKDNASFVGMQDLSGEFRVDAMYNDGYYIAKGEPTPDFGDGVDVYDVSGEKPAWNINGSKLVLPEGKTIYVEGDLTLSLSEISGEGFIVATGTISINVSKFTSKDIGIYSVNGDVNFYIGTVSEDGGVGLYGLVYAPKGTVVANTSAFNMEGCVVAQNIESGSGGFKIKYNDSLGTVEKIKTYEDDIRTIAVARESIKNFVEELKESYSESDIKVNIITYDEKARIGLEKYNITDRTLDEFNEYVNHIDLSDKEGANLGDGLRIAHYNMDPNADKYIVVFSAIDPNRWTKNEAPGNFKLDNGEEVGDTLIMNTGGDQAIDYSKEAAGLIKSSARKSFFIDVNPGETLGSLSGIAEAAGGELFNPEAKSEPDKTDFESELNDDLINSIFGTIINDASYLEPKVTVSFTEKIPMDRVDVIEADDFDAITATGDLVLKSIDKVNVIPVVGEDKVKIELGDIGIKVKYEQIGKTTYPVIPATYTITNPVNDEVVGQRVIDISALDVEVEWTIDIQ